MSLIDISLVKKNLRVFATDEDTEIAAYQAAAETIIAEYVDRVVYESGGTAPSGDDGTAIEVNAAITAAILLLTAELYENREADWKAQGTPTNDLALNATLPRTVRALLAPYRVWRTFDECADVATVQ